MSDDFDDLSAITAILEQRALARHKTILAQETALRGELDEIENLRHQTLRQDADAPARRMLGADGLWQGWLAGRRMRLNQDLAMLQVRKSELQSAAQTAFARHQVTQDLSRDSRELQRRKGLDLSERQAEALYQSALHDPEAS